MMIVVSIFDGLGNQMFHYAFGRQMAERCGVPMKMDLSESVGNVWSYGLDAFNITADIVSPDDIRSFQKSAAQSGSSGVLDRMARLVRPDYVRVTRERFFHYDPSTERITPPVWLRGYWQSERYFTDIADTIRSEFTLKAPLTASSQAMADDIRRTEAVCLHIRRGDYLTNPRAVVVHGVCSLDYYDRAVKLISARVTKPVFYVFSDDIPWARENLRLPYPMVYADFNGNERNYEDLHLMSQCKHHIIANSSFSWWGAWLGEKDDQIVIAPKRWFLTQKHNTKDLVPERWIKL